MPSILLIADGVLVREGFKRLLHDDLRDIVLAEAADAAAGRRQFARRAWDLVILDIALSGHDAFELLRQMRADRPQASILVLAADPSLEPATRALRLGATGFVSKRDSRADLISAVKAALAGRRYLSRALRGRMDARQAPEAAPPDLSARERSILLDLAAGKRPTDIAAALHISIKTVSTYRRRILEKLHLSSTADLVRYAIARRLT